MNGPTIAQLRNLADRAATGLTADEQQRLRDGISQLEALQAVARGYCPDCGRGDAAPTVEHWETERRRAETAKAAVDRVRALHQPAECVNVRCKLKQWCIGCDPHGIEDCNENPWPCPTITALDQTAPLTPAEEARLAQAGIDTPGCDCGHDGMGVSWHRDDCLWRWKQVDPTA